MQMKILQIKIHPSTTVAIFLLKYLILYTYVLLYNIGTLLKKLFCYCFISYIFADLNLIGNLYMIKYL